MKAVGLLRYLPIDDPESLLDVDLPKPTPDGHDLLVEVKAISVNPVDTKQRAPKEQIETAPKVLGWDVAGVVKGTGKDVTQLPQFIKTFKESMGEDPEKIAELEDKAMQKVYGKTEAQMETFYHEWLKWAVKKNFKW